MYRQDGFPSVRVLSGYEDTKRGLELKRIEVQAEIYKLEEFRRTRMAAYEIEALHGHTEHELMKENKRARFMEIKESR